MRLRQWIRLKLLRSALWWAQRKPAPTGGILLMGAGAEATDVILVRLGTEEKSQRFTFRKLIPGGAEGNWHLAANEKALTSKLTDEALLSTTRVRVGRFLRGYEFTYNSLREFIWCELSRYPQRSIWLDRAEQKRFNRKALVKRDRTDVLRFFVENTLLDHAFKSGPSSLMTQLYSNRWVRHPEEDRLLNHYDLVLQSLEQSDDLTRANYGYKITPKAVTTLSQYEEDDRRHSDNRRQQVILGFLTAALVFVALVQAGIAVWTELNPDPAPAAQSSTSQPAPPT